MPDDVTKALSHFKHKRRLAIWVTLVILQGTSAAFFVGDVATDFLYSGLIAHTVIEGTATIALICGVVLGSFEIYRISQYATNADKAIQDMKASFSSLVLTRFQEWSLTSTESEVALLLLKGFDVAEIAELRNTATGTVRAQLSHIYGKSSHPNRGRFVSSFLDNLIETPVR